MLKKLVQALTCGAVGVATANGLMCLVAGKLAWFGPDATLRVGVPAALVGMLFFPVNVKTLGSRWGFAARAAVATLASGLANRVLWLGAQTDGGVWSVLTHPTTLVAWDGNAQLCALAGAVAGLAGWLLQPPMLRLARGTLPPRIERISDAMKAIPCAAEARRTRAG